MKTISHVAELIIIVLGFIFLVIPEILYSCVLRGRDWMIDTISEL